MHVMRRLQALAARSLPALALAAGLVSCANNPLTGPGDRYDRRLLAETLAEHDISPALLIGEFPLAPKSVVDGDTIKVGGLDSSLRLLAIDTEETFKSKKDTRLFQRLGFEGYLAEKQSHTDRPVKCATPMGMEAKHWAQDFFEGVNVVRLERDHPKEIRGRYGRLLAYVFVQKDGKWINYNIEAVRAGMTPYFSKYGYSRRFHDEFVAAQEEARAARRGIWSDDEQHYLDYDVRLAWWNGRADFIERFERDAEQRDDLVVLTHWDALDKLSQLEGEEVEILGGVGEIKPSDGNIPTRALLSRRMFSDFPLIFFDDEVYEKSRIQSAKGEFVRVRGTVTSYTFKRRRGRKEGRKQLQIEVKLPQQIVVSDTAPDPVAQAVPPTGPARNGVAGGLAEPLPSEPPTDESTTPDETPATPPAVEPDSPQPPAQPDAPIED
jgi:endonuclease YncB( thermonuclease family)